ncbi:MAG: hypothetical protein QOD90_967 [Mycobacterium sp.]|jgi:hypothetical protein|nr:hypothetical protein [Mycobacterium sp.]
MQAVWHGAVLSALDGEQGMVNDGAVTVFEALAALTTHTVHSHFLALPTDEFRLPR